MGVNTAFQTNLKILVFMFHFASIFASLNTLPKQKLNELDSFSCEGQFKIDETILTYKMNNVRKLAVAFEVFGIVQGVFFRKYTQKKARELTIRGWCKNTIGGSVLGQMEGEEKSIQRMKDWLKTTGSPNSRIDKAEFRNEREIEAYSFKDFGIKH